MGCLPMKEKGPHRTAMQALALQDKPYFFFATAFTAASALMKP